MGDTAADVRAAYKDAKLTEEFSGLNSENIIRAVDSDGRAIGFSFDGNSGGSDAVPDSAVVQLIRAGTEDVARGFEVCSG